MSAAEILNRMWRCLRNDASDPQMARLYGAISALHQIGALTSDEAELWLRRIKECPGHDDEGGRVWCAYCGLLMASTPPSAAEGIR